MNKNDWTEIGPHAAFRIRVVPGEDQEHPFDRIYEIQKLGRTGFNWVPALSLLGSELEDLRIWWQSQERNK